jgi:signal transduction histidine kinase
MGLAIAKGIVEAHSGRIWIEDGTENHGARIVFTVPVGDDDPVRNDNIDVQGAEISDKSEPEM